MSCRVRITWEITVLTTGSQSQADIYTEYLELSEVEERPLDQRKLHWKETTQPKRTKQRKISLCNRSSWKIVFPCCFKKEDLFQGGVVTFREGT